MSKRIFIKTQKNQILKNIFFITPKNYLFTNIMNGNKIVLLGDSHVGKSSIITRLISQTFFDHNESTIGASYHHFILNDITLDIWDTAGQEKYRSITPMYYRNAKVALIIFDVTNEKSYKSVAYWLKELKYSGNYKIYVIGNKVDLLNGKFKSFDDDLNENRNIYYTSAKSNIGITELFNNITQYFKEYNENENKNKPIVDQGHKNKIVSENKCFGCY